MNVPFSEIKPGSFFQIGEDVYLKTNCNRGVRVGSGTFCPCRSGELVIRRNDTILPITTRSFLSKQQLS